MMVRATHHAGFYERLTLGYDELGGMMVVEFKDVCGWMFGSLRFIYARAHFISPSFGQ
jgi:hypothetical protein